MPLPQRTDLPTVLPKVIRAGLYIVPFLPLYVANHLMFPYITGRNFVFRIVVEVLLVPYAALCVVSRPHRPRWSPIAAALAAFVAVVAVADALGVDPSRSFWSTYERMSGLLALIHVALFFLLLKAALQTPDQWRRYFSVSFAVSAVIAAGALVESTRLGFERPNGTLGNPGFLAGYLLLHVFVCLLVVTHVRRHPVKLLLVAGLALDLAAIFLTGTRAALLTLVLTMPIVALFWFRGRVGPLMVSRAGIRVVVILTALAATSLFFAPLRARLDRGLEGLELRVEAWRVIWNAARSNLWTGVGQENFLPIWQQHQASFSERLDRAHNIVLDLLVGAGLLGVAAFAVLIGAFALGILAVWRRDPEAGAPLVGFLAAYLFFMLFWFDTFETYFLLATMLAFVDQQVARAAAPAPAASATAPRWAAVTAAAVAAAMAGAVYVVNVRPMLAAGHLIAASRVWNERQDVAEAQAHLERAMEQDRAQRRETAALMGFFAPRVVNLRGRDEPVQVQRFLARAIAELEAHAAAPSVETETVRLLGVTYAAARVFDPANRQRAIDTFTRALAMSPYDELNYRAFVNFYLGERNYPAAVDVQRKQVALDPSREAAQIELLRLTLRAGMTPGPELEVFRRRLAITESLGAMAAGYIKGGDLAMARLVLDEMRRREPANPLLSQYLAILDQIERGSPRP